VGEMAEDGKFRVEKFNEKNYQLWKMQMEYYLYQKDLFLPLGGIKKKSTTMKDKEWEVLDRKALGMIRLSLAASMAFNISK
jgi:RecA-family ATPase